MAQTFLGGTLNFLAGGIPYRLAGSFKVKLGGVVREAKTGPSGVLGYTQKYMASELDAELVLDGTLSVAALKALTDTTLVVNLDNGRTYMFQDAWQNGDDPELDVVDAKFQIKFAAMSALEL